jgi:phage/conjugal plasmid C-4 type zinc finger TraR family protein
MDGVDRAADYLERAMAEYRQRQDKPKYAPRLTDACHECGDPIESARIKAVPHATRCVECEISHDLLRKRNSNV